MNLAGQQIRSYLYVPGDDPRRIEKALTTGADAVVIDLEDAVAPSLKKEARRNAAEALESEPARPTSTRWPDSTCPDCGCRRSSRSKA